MNIFSYIKRKKNDAYREIKASLNEGNIILKVDTTEIYCNNQQDAIQSKNFGNQGFSIFTAEPVGSDDLQNDSFIMITESSDHDQLASMTCLQKVLDKIEEKYEEVYHNVFV